MDIDSHFVVIRQKREINTRTYGASAGVSALVIGIPFTQ